ncbi:MAG: DUF1015 domain-containing protein [Planctomycetes bacterium]|nr:DUF1015 domain-containing protein [Planctomycetota bacterium]
MAEIVPFRGYLYNPEKVGDISLVLTKPYDKIDDPLREKYFERSPHNFCHVELPRPEPADGHYATAASTLQKWMREGVLFQYHEPALFLYTQRFSNPLFPEEVLERTAFIALLRLVEFGRGVRPHERTLSGPKADRLKMMRATGCHLGHIFMLYSDPEQSVNQAIRAAAESAPPFHQGTDDDGVAHAIRPITDRAVVSRVQAAMKGRELFIADGHHRYETALNYRNERRAAGVNTAVAEGADFRMCSFVCMEDPALVILPTHRVVRNAPPLLREQFLKHAEKEFTVISYRFSGEQDRERVMEEFLEDLRFEGTARSVVGAALPDAREFFLLCLKDESAMKRARPDASAAFRSLDVAVLHTLVLEKFYGIDAGRLERQENVTYMADAREAAEAGLSGRGGAQAAFILNPTRVRDVAAVAVAGERMPQKSTDFYPKLASGLVVFRISEKGGPA